MEFFETCFARHDKKDTEFLPWKSGHKSTLTIYYLPT